ncbi:hypothetical protein OVA26_17280 [Microbacterium sp. SL62]|uniref:hypothetical protein n=1 Tax=Microbacterium sp. SL62 TaxID=2995139 RepID=UPI0022727709|nr:hypothetical protein [Microbacterium sp. SL62]MCY1718691.1 hypothetical protein [Microbacterium sp. SL62]
MVANEKSPASTTVWYFVGATFVFALPMMLFPGMPWWARVATIAFGGAFIAAGLWQLRREARGKSDRQE